MSDIDVLKEHLINATTEIDNVSNAYFLSKKTQQFLIQQLDRVVSENQNLHTTIENLQTTLQGLVPKKEPEPPAPPAPPEKKKDK